MTRVAHVLRKYDPAEPGGTETHVAEITRRLLAEGFHSEVHAPRGPSLADTALGPEVPLLRYRAFCPFLGPAEERRALWANAGNIASFDVPLRLVRDRGIALAHLHTAGRIGGGVRAAMRLTRRQYLVSVHGPRFSAGDFLEEELARRQRKLLDLGKPIGLLLGARRVLRDAARIISFNDDEHAQLESRFGRRAVRMDQGVDAARFASGDAARARRRWPHLGEQQVVAQIGRLCEQKDQILALRAFARGAPEGSILALAGPETDRGYRLALENEAGALGIANRVRFLGQISTDEVADLLACARLVLAPSRHEAFGLCVLEAWAASRPVLFSAVGGLRDLARAAGAGAGALSLEDRDPRAWGTALGALLRDHLRLRAAGEEGARLVRERFSWERCARELAQLYAEVLSEAPP